MVALQSIKRFELQGGDQVAIGVGMFGEEGMGEGKFI